MIGLDELPFGVSSGIDMEPEADDGGGGERLGQWESYTEEGGPEATEAEAEADVEADVEAEPLSDGS